MQAQSSPLVRNTRHVDVEALPEASVIVEVSGCGVCHTDLGFMYEGVPTRHALPLTLGHEISGVVRYAGSAARSWIGRAVVVPAVMPCGDCDLCKVGRGAICAKQIFPGNDEHGGFASHVQVPARGLCPVDLDALAQTALELSDLSVIADAVTTPYQAIINADLKADELAVFVGIGGVGAFGVQIAAALGATVAALDVDTMRTERAKELGAAWAEPITQAPHLIKKALRKWAKSEGLPLTGWKIFETSGHPQGQTLAFSLLCHGAHLGIVGYTPHKVEVRLSNLMAFDATARGTWGCLPKYYPAVVDLVTSGKVRVDSLTQRYPMSQINEIFEDLHAGKLTRRPVLIPDFEGIV